nr:MAG TPA: hypothetical protein [Caudoviricetes sp.]
MKYCVRVRNKKNDMNCFIYRNATVGKLKYILLCLENLDTDKYYVEIKNEEEK